MLACALAANADLIVSGGRSAHA
ncbi:MAG: hypothetical protein AB1671_29150 [Thermodesulfobacteriota bacterium]